MRYTAINLRKKTTVETKSDRRHWSKIFKSSNRAQDAINPTPDAAPEFMDRLRKERSRTQVHFLIGLVLSIAAVQSAFTWKVNRLPNTPLPKDNELNIDLVEMMEPVVEKREERNQPEAQPNTSSLLLDLSEILLTNKTLPLSQPEPLPLMERAIPVQRSDDEVDDPFELRN